MADDAFIKAVKGRIERRLADLNLTPITAATRAGLPRDAIRNIFRPDSGLPRVDTLKSISSALETTISFLVGEAEQPSPQATPIPPRLDFNGPVPIPIIGRTGPFDERREDGEPLGIVELRVPGFASNLRAIEIADDSSDHYFAAGRIVIWHNAGEEGLRIGDDVVISRTRDSLVQYRVMRIESPRAKSLGFAPSLGSLSSDLDEFPDIEMQENTAIKVQILGLVVADIEFHAQPFGGDA